MKEAIEIQNTTRLGKDVVNLTNCISPNIHQRNGTSLVSGGVVAEIIPIG